MSFSRFLWRWFVVALTRDWKTSQVVWAIVALTLAGLGWLASRTPDLQETVSDLAWKLPLGAFAALGALRAVIAPYWIYRDKERELAEATIGT